MSVEHWFDNLSRPHNRRTTLKGAALVGLALIVPGMRASGASATPNEPCFGPCNEAAAKRWADQDASCRSGSQYFSYGAMFPAAAGPVLLLSLIDSLNVVRCGSAAEVKWHRDSLACEGSECGNPGKYPGGGTKAKETCNPAYEKACGDTCCRNFVDCCLSKKTGKYVCYAAGNNCEGA